MTGKVIAFLGRTIKRRERDNEFRRAFDAWFDQTFNRAEWNPQEVEWLAIFCEYWYLEGQGAELERQKRRWFG